MGVMSLTRICLGCRRSMPKSKFFPEQHAKDKVSAFCWGCVEKSLNNRQPKPDPVAMSKKHWTEIQRTP